MPDLDAVRCCRHILAENSGVRARIVRPIAFDLLSAERASWKPEDFMAAHVSRESPTPRTVQGGIADCVFLPLARWRQLRLTWATAHATLRYIPGSQSGERSLSEVRRLDKKRPR
jgi:hypothetical protein